MHFLNILEASASCLISLLRKPQMLKSISNTFAKQTIAWKSKVKKSCLNLALRAIPWITALLFTSLIINQNMQMDPFLKIKETFMGILRKGKISIFFENLLIFNFLFTKFLRRLTTWYCFKPLTFSQPEIVAKVSNIKANWHNKYFYVANILQAKVWLNKKLCKALINIGAEINVMTEKIQENFDLFIQLNPALRLILHFGHYQNFIGVYKNVNIIISGLIT